MRPSVTHEPFHPIEFANSKIISNFSENGSHLVTTPNQIRWLPFDIPSASSANKVDFLRGMFTMCGSGGASNK